MVYLKIAARDNNGTMKTCRITTVPKKHQRSRPLNEPASRLLMTPVKWNGSHLVL